MGKLATWATKVVSDIEKQGFAIQPLNEFEPHERTIFVDLIEMTFNKTVTVQVEADNVVYRFFK